MESFFYMYMKNILNVRNITTTYSSIKINVIAFVTLYSTFKYYSVQNSKNPCLFFLYPHCMWHFLWAIHHIHTYFNNMYLVNFKYYLKTNFCENNNNLNYKNIYYHILFLPLFLIVSLISDYKILSKEWQHQFYICYTFHYNLRNLFSFGYC